MIDIVERLRFDAARCEATFSKGVATNIEEAATEIERLRAALQRGAADLVGCCRNPDDPFVAASVRRLSDAARGVHEQ